MTAAPPTQAEIENALRLQEEFDRGKPGTPAEAMAVASRIYADWQAARENNPPDRQVPDLLSYVRDLADNGSVTNPDRGMIRAFWSYRSQPEGAPRAVRHQFLAQACGQTRGYQVLEETPAGGRLDSYHLSNPLVQAALAKDYEVDVQDVAKVNSYAWKTVSDRYALAAEGPVVIFATDITEGSILGANEMPIVLAHEKVGKDAVSFPLEMPRHEHLPPEIDALIANPPLRAQVRMEDHDPDKSPKDFAAKLAALDIPENQREAHEAALWRLSTANTYDELTTRAEQNAIPQQKTSAFTPGMTTRPASRTAAPRGPTGHGVYNPAIAPPAPALTPAQPGVER
ncbi:hypothetical protein [Streptomyces vilmorinianum]|uniref:hypothetical protein n=1 Tax=Streptomyces vilmorinianum TaxID=3051092 RepID=UPI0010FB91B9|nr:hypothetical protein [Streptomyces vilmorinianum]